MHDRLASVPLALDPCSVRPTSTATRTSSSASYYLVSYHTITNIAVYVDISFERIFMFIMCMIRIGKYSVATLFGPTCLAPCPLLVFKRSESTGSLTLVATGALNSVNPDRIILKKVSLYLCIYT